MPPVFPGEVPHLVVHPRHAEDVVPEVLLGLHVSRADARDDVLLEGLAEPRDARVRRGLGRGRTRVVDVTDARLELIQLALHRSVGKLLQEVLGRERDEVLLQRGGSQGDLLRRGVGEQVHADTPVEVGDVVSPEVHEELDLVTVEVASGCLSQRVGEVHSHVVETLGLALHRWHRVLQHQVIAEDVRRALVVGGHTYHPRADDLGEVHLTSLDSRVELAHAVHVERAVQTLLDLAQDVCALLPGLVRLVELLGERVEAELGGIAVTGEQGAQQLLHLREVSIDLRLQLRSGPLVGLTLRKGHQRLQRLMKLLLRLEQALTELVPSQHRGSQRLDAQGFRAGVGLLELRLAQLRTQLDDRLRHLGALHHHLTPLLVDLLAQPLEHRSLVLRLLTSLGLLLLR